MKVPIYFLTMKNRRDINKSPDTCFAQHFHILGKTCSSLDISTNLLYSILCLSFKTVTLILLFPYEQVNGNLVPAIIFKGLPSTFHAFLLSIVMAFSGAFNALMLATNKPKIAKFCSYYSLGFMVSAVVLFFWAVFQTVFNLRQWHG
uniref:PGG domain-containing protein n=1 Tax=Cucumis sativus TaxID=3659 RepID=A0A0A0KT20_CUCSA